jgi:hypothetical protein
MTLDSRRHGKEKRLRVQSEVSEDRAQASLRRALKALLLKDAPSRPGTTSADPAKSIPPDRSRSPLTLSRKANHSSSESYNSRVRGRSRNEPPLNLANNGPPRAGKSPTTGVKLGYLPIAGGILHSRITFAITGVIRAYKGF